jgi:hypothetical protein
MYCISGIKTAHSLLVYQTITQDQWVIDAISGYCTDFDSQLFTIRIPNEIPFNKQQWQIVDN